MIVVMAASARPRISAGTSPTSSGSSAKVGSSNGITRGDTANARAIATQDGLRKGSAGHRLWVLPDPDDLDVRLDAIIAARCHPSQPTAASGVDDARPRQNAAARASVTLT